MENNGWIKLHRRIMDKGYYKKSDYKSVWFHLLLRANHRDKEFWFNGENILIKEGQFITGRKQLSLELGISESKIERILNFFEKTEQQIKQQKTNKNRIITILRWNIYQESEQQSEQPVNNKRTTSEQPVNTNKKVKNEKNEKEIKKEIKKERKTTNQNSQEKSAQFLNLFFSKTQKNKNRIPTKVVSILRNTISKAVMVLTQTQYESVLNRCVKLKGTDQSWEYYLDSVWREAGKIEHGKQKNEVPVIGKILKDLAK